MNYVMHMDWRKEHEPFLDFSYKFLRICRPASAFLSAVVCPPKPLGRLPTLHTSPLLTPDEHHRLQMLGGILLYYCLAIDSTGLPAVTAIESALANATQLTQQASERLLAYFRNYPENILVLKACDMHLHTQSDASYCTCLNGHSVAGGIAYLGNVNPTEINGPITVHSTQFSNSVRYGVHR